MKLVVLLSMCMSVAIASRSNSNTNINTNVNDGHINGFKIQSAETAALIRARSVGCCLPSFVAILRPLTDDDDDVIDMVHLMKHQVFEMPFHDLVVIPRYIRHCISDWHIPLLIDPITSLIV
jgi:hypothetical protein